jgi:hypothetical protein
MTDSPSLSGDLGGAVIDIRTKSFPDESYISKKPLVSQRLFGCEEE